LRGKGGLAQVATVPAVRERFGGRRAKRIVAWARVKQG
jgi:hypothetical protein